MVEAASASVSADDASTPETRSAAEWISFLMTEQQQEEFCASLAMTGDRDLLFEVFDRAAGPDVAGIPSNEELFAEVVSRC